MPNSNSVQSGDAELYEIIDAEWGWRESELGAQTMKATVQDRLPDVEAATHERRAKRWAETKTQLDQMDSQAFSPEARIDFESYLFQINRFVENARFKTYERPATADSAFWRTLAFEAYRLRLNCNEDAEAYLSRLSDFPRYIESQIANMRSGVDRGFGPPRVCMVGREEPIRAIASARSGADTPYFLPFEKSRKLFGAEKLERALRVIETDVIPAFAKLLDFVSNYYFPRLPESIAAIDQPDGEAYYRSELNEYTTTDLSPEAIHEIGKAEVARIQTEMAGVAHEAGFGSDYLKMLDFMKSEPRFYATTKKQLLGAAAYVCKKFDGVVHDYFGRLPHQRFALIETPSEIARFDTFGRGAPDRYLLNTHNLPSRPLYSLPALTLHESAPGHSFQMSITEELDLRPFRKQYISAFGEGWGLYVERLGDEMGMYETPFERMGMLSFQMWRAVRLVVDPGMHALGWSRDQAQSYLRENTAIAEHEIVTEIDRYISWPGQASSYYLGMLQIMNLRREAEETLGERFSLRDFHDKVLSLGCVPLTVLKTSIESWIGEQE